MLAWASCQIFQSCSPSQKNLRITFRPFNILDFCCWTNRDQLQAKSLSFKQFPNTFLFTLSSYSFLFHISLTFPFHILQDDEVVVTRYWYWWFLRWLFSIRSSKKVINCLCNICFNTLWTQWLFNQLCLHWEHLFIQLYQCCELCIYYT